MNPYNQLTALQKIYNDVPVDQRHLIEPFISEEIRHIRAMRLIERVDKIMKLAIIMILCLTTIHWLGIL